MKIKRYNPNTETGLTTVEINERKKSGLVNCDNSPKTKSIKEILASNIFTFFNFLNITLGISVLLAGFLFDVPKEGIKNCLFMGIIFVNTMVSIIEEIISKKIIDRLSILSASKVSVVRNGKIEEKEINELVLDDITILSPGKQVVCDSIFLGEEIEVNESFITGESIPVTKTKGEMLLSGSFIVSGTGYAKVEHIGSDNYISKISTGAKYVKKSNSVVMGSFTKLLKIISLFIVPIGIVMFAKELNVSNFDVTSSVFGTTAAIIGMIPEGLILLTTSVMAVSVIRLSKYKVLVQKLEGVESLARVDIICLDKTGTLTEGKMKLTKVIPYDKTNTRKINKILIEISTNSKDSNATIDAIKEEYTSTSNWKVTEFIPFSSGRKFSGIKFENKGVYYLGAPEILFSKNKKILESSKEYQSESRVLVLAEGKTLSKNPKGLKLLAFILIEDIIRKNASSTIKYFQKEGVIVKIISGDSLETVMSISNKCGLTNLKGIDVSTVNGNSLKELVEDTDIFARVNPLEKELIIKYLQANGHTVAMTGDGVNDVLALKASDCGISLRNGTDSARNVSELVLLDSNFDSLPQVVREGRRTVNNIERSASLLLVKTIYTLLLIILSIIFSRKYFFVPIQLTLITNFTIGVPSFILALEPNSERITGNFLKKILSRSLPVALTVFINILLVTILQPILDLSHELTSTLSVYLTCMIGFIYLFKICEPFNGYRKALYAFLIIGYSICALFGHDFFNISDTSITSVIIFVILSILSVFIYKLLDFYITKLIYKKHQNNEKTKKNVQNARK